MTPDMMPLLFESNLGDIFYNTGHGHLGWTLSAETAEILAKKILNWSPQINRQKGLLETVKYFKSIPKSKLLKVEHKNFSKHIKT